MDRKALIMSEFHTYFPEDALTLEFMNLSDRALKIREDRRKAASENRIYVP